MPRKDWDPTAHVTDGAVTGRRHEQVGPYLAREIQPLEAERELDRLSGLFDLVKPFALSAEVTVDGEDPTARLTRQLVVASDVGKGREGVLLAFAYNLANGGYGASPWVVQTATRRTDGAQAVQGPDGGTVLLGPFATPIGSLTTPLVLPWPVPFGDDVDVAIFATNGNGAGMDSLAQGFVMGITWSRDQARDIRRALYANQKGVRLWAENLFTGEK